MKYLVLMAALFIVSCDESPRSRLSGPQGRPADLPQSPYQETGPELVEDGKVLDVVFRLGSTTTSTSGTPGYSKTIDQSAWQDPWGIKSKTVRVPAVTSTNTVTVEDQYAVVFECQHGKFIIESLGKDSKACLLWKKLKPGDLTKIRYKEVFQVIPAEGTRQVVEYEFIDANKAKEKS